mmetsp:Transcript_31851/g.57904  ORF Transcript_31851/g.57904 Transcript_31851/m.57904 type:complete len:241 (+) Transcript_31851:109-831(+)
MTVDRYRMYRSGFNGAVKLLLPPTISPWTGWGWEWGGGGGEGKWNGRDVELLGEDKDSDPEEAEHDDADDEGGALSQKEVRPGKMDPSKMTAARRTVVDFVTARWGGRGRMERLGRGGETVEGGTDVDFGIAVGFGRGVDIVSDSTIFFSPFFSPPFFSPPFFSSRSSGRPFTPSPSPSPPSPSSSPINPIGSKPRRRSVAALATTPSLARSSWPAKVATPTTSPSPEGVRRRTTRPWTP